MWCGTRAGTVAQLELRDGRELHTARLAGGTCKGVMCFSDSTTVLVSSDVGLCVVSPSSREAAVLLEGAFLCPAVATVDGAHAVAVSSTGRVVLLSRQLAVQWSVSLVAKRPLRQQAFLSSPAVVAPHSVWVVSTGVCYRLDLTGGAVLLECALSELGGCFRSPTPVGDSGQVIVCGTRAIALVCDTGLSRLVVCEHTVTLSTRAVLIRDNNNAATSFVVATECGRLLVFALDSFTLLRSVSVGSFAIYATPAVLADGTLILCTRGNAIMRWKL